MKHITNIIIYLAGAFSCLLASVVFAVPTSSLPPRDLPLYDVEYIKANFIKDRILPKGTLLINSLDTRAIYINAPFCFDRDISLAVDVVASSNFEHF